jgi:hypothetical protein
MADELFFDVEFTVNARIAINKKVFEQVDEDFKKSFYDLDMDSDIVEMVAYNLLQGRKISELDGFANLPSSYAKWDKYPEYLIESTKKINEKHLLKD